MNKHVASTWHNIGIVFSRKQRRNKEGSSVDDLWEGNSTLAKDAFRNAIRIYKAVFGLNHPVIAVSQ